MRPEQFLNIAEDWLQSSSQCEAHLRSAVSRGYYAAFHVCEDLAHTLELSFERGARHESLTETLLMQDSKELRKLGNQLKRIKLDRVVADYKLNRKFAPFDARSSLKTARDIFDSGSAQLAVARSIGGSK